jgi:hypothetical protein
MQTSQLECLQDYYVQIVEFDGATAGRFGAAIEARVVTAKNEVQYTQRITTTRYRWVAFEEVGCLASTSCTSISWVLVQQHGKSSDEHWPLCQVVERPNNVHSIA